MLYVINYYCPLDILLCLMIRLTNHFHYTLEVFLLKHNAKATSTTRIAGGFFVSYSFFGTRKTRLTETGLCPNKKIESFSFYLKALYSL